MKFTDSQIAEIKDRNACDAYVMAQVTPAVALRRKPGGGHVGPCPFCSPDPQRKSDSRFECDAEKWVCAACASGGDIIALVAKDRGLDPSRDFVEIVTALGGSAELEETPQTAQRAGARAFRGGLPDLAPPPYVGTALAGDWLRGWQTAQRQAAYAAQARERERSRLFNQFWRKARPWRGTPVEDYLCGKRRLAVPTNACLRYLADAPLFADGSETEPLLVHRGPAMLAAIWNADPAAPAAVLAGGDGFRFAGLHFTFLDLGQAKGKAIIRHPATGEILPAKKSRGSKQGGYIDLGGAAAREAVQMVAGEGIENVLTAYTAQVRAGRGAAAINYRCGIDLGNVAGRALDRVRHPTLTDAAGRARNVPGPTPDLASPAMPVPAGVRRLIWMCDGDSEPVTTRNAMERATRRHARDGLTQKLLWPGEGMDWNDRIMTP